MRTLALLLGYLWLGVMSCQAIQSDVQDTRLIHDWQFVAGGGRYGVSETRRVITEPESKCITLHFGPLGQVHYKYPAAFPLWPLLVTSSVTGVVGFIFLRLCRHD